METRFDRVNNETARGLSSNIKTVTADYQMLKTDLTLVADSTSNTVNVTLPSLAEAMGLTYSIEAPAGATNDVSLLEKEGGTEIADMDADDDNVVVYCTGRNWRKIYDGVA